jgi:hypothetical protein
MVQSLEANPEKVRFMRVGQIVNMLSNDAKRLKLAAENFYALITAPFEVLVIIILAWEQVGYACLGM